MTKGLKMVQKEVLKPLLIAETQTMQLFIYQERLPVRAKNKFLTLIVVVINMFRFK
jgi:hypothetical protein